jgi:hypothetical protein
LLPLGGLNYYDPHRATGFLARNDAAFRSLKAIMSDRIDILIFLKAKLNNELLTSRARSPAIHQLVSTADNISDEHFNQLAPFLPHSPKLMLAVQALNNAIVGGMSSPATFYDYVGLLAASLQA